MRPTIDVISENTSFVRPQYFYISGFSNIPHINYYFVFLFFVYFISVCGNSLVMFIIATERSLHIPKYLGVLNLALADFGESNAQIPSTIKTFLFNSQYISYEACLSNLFFVYLFSTVQSVTLVVLAYDRLVAICLPLKYHSMLTNTTMCVMLTGSWVFNSLIIGSSAALLTRLSYCKSIVINSHFCDHGPLYRMACNDNSANSIIAKINTVIFIHSPLTFIVVSYICILLALFRITSWEGRLKALKTCISHLLVVAVFFLPILSIYIAALTRTLHPNARIICLSLAYAIPPMLNPIIYVLNTAEIQVLMKKILRRGTSSIVPRNN